MAATNLTLYINELRETAVFVSGTTYSLYGSDIKDSGDGSFDDPLVYVGGVLQLPATYTVDDVNGTVTFSVLPVGTVTVTYTWEVDDSISFDLIEYQWSEPSNIKVNTDVNGRRNVVEPTNHYQPWAGRMSWNYGDTDFYVIVRHIYTTASATFRVAIGSLPADSPLKNLNGLKIVSSPGWSTIPGVPCLSDYGVDVVQLEGY